MTLPLSKPRLALAALALLLIVLSWGQVLAVSARYVQRDVPRGNTPLTYIAPADLAPGEKVPGVIIAHGFSGSRQLMLPYAYYLADAGYGTILLDFAGHGANNTPLTTAVGEGRPDLARGIQDAFETLIVQPEIDPQRIALLGHSMGSGAVMIAGLERPEWYSAVVAISPTGADVSPERPPNLLLQAGSLEAPFVANAEDLLVRAGGTAVSPADFANGRARDFQLINNVEHITILFNAQSHAEALNWFNRTWSLEFATSYRDRRMVSFGAHLLGWLLLATAVAPLLPQRTLGHTQYEDYRRRPWFFIAAVLAPLVATAVLFLLSRLADLSSLGGILVGGTLALWLFIFGLVWLFAGWYIPRPTRPDFLWALGLFAFWLMAFGALGHLVWLNWWLSPARLWRWPLLALACLPWMLAGGLALANLAVRWRLLVWLGQSVVLMVGLALAILLVPGLGFLALILPILPIILLLLVLVTLAVDRPWAYALAHAGFFAWLLLAVFPLV